MLSDEFKVYNYGVWNENFKRKIYLSFSFKPKKLYIKSYSLNQTHLRVSDINSNQFIYWPDPSVKSSVLKFHQHVMWQANFRTFTRCLRENVLIWSVDRGIARSKRKERNKQFDRERCKMRTYIGNHFERWTRFRNFMFN